MKRRSRFKLALLPLATVVMSFLLLLTGSVYSQTGDVINDEQLDVPVERIPGLGAFTARADLVVVGRTSNVASNLVVNEYGDELIVSDVSIKVEEVLKGEAAPEQELLLAGLWSGQIGEIAMASSDAPLFVQGERFVLFLEGEAETGFSVLDGDLGKFNIDELNQLPEIGQTLDLFRGEVQAALSGEPLPPITEDNTVEQGTTLDGDPGFEPTGTDYTFTGQRWPGASPVVNYVLNNPGFNDANAGTIQQQNNAINLAADTWTTTGGTNFSYRFNGATALNTQSNNGINVVMVRNAANGTTLATAFWWFNTTTNIYTDCDIVFWDANMAFSAINAANTFDIRSVVLHEFGHCLGLNHSLVGQASMFATFGVGEQRRLLHADDLLGVRLIYGAGSANLWANAYGYNAGGWRIEQHPRLMGDVNGDGRADVVGFASTGVFVSLSTGGKFSTPSLWVSQFGSGGGAGGWQVANHPRFLADVNGDGMDDIVGFANDGVYVSTSLGVGFNEPARWVASYGYNAGGWRVDKHPRIMADVNGDGRADVVGFGNVGVYVSTSTGTGFTTPSLWVGGFGYDAGGWRVEKHPRFMADVNGDGRDDVVGFANGGVRVATSTGTGFNTPTTWVNSYGYDAGGWRVEFHPRFLADVNGDGRDDVVGFGNPGVYVSTSTGTSFSAPALRLNGFGYNAGGWRVGRHPRYMADVNGDGRADVVGFANNGVYVSTSTGNNFTKPALIWVNTYGYNAGGWRVEFHPRYMADVNGDGRADVVGFGNAGVYVSRSAFPNVFE